jgi:hypothetical protein
MHVDDKQHFFFFNQQTVFLFIKQVSADEWELAVLCCLTQFKIPKLCEAVCLHILLFEIDV